MTRKSFIAGNWKMHNTIEQSSSLASAVAAAENKNNADIMIAPSFTALAAVAQAVKGSAVKVFAQDCFYEEKGAFTSQIAPNQIKDAGAAGVILGHSERRALFGDTNEILNKKLRAALSAGLQVVFCVGETLTERELNKTYSVIQNQIEGGLKGFSAQELKDMVIAYEPVWAIGTGKTATPQQAQQVHADIRELLHNKYYETFSQNIRILYGGSVKTDNVDSLMAQPDIDGVLVGGQSLSAESFARIINYK